MIHIPPLNAAFYNPKAGSGPHLGLVAIHTEIAALDPLGNPVTSTQIRPPRCRGSVPYRTRPHRVC